MLAVKYLGLTRGGNAGAIAILEVDGGVKYYDINGLSSLISNAQDAKHVEELEQAMNALQNIVNYEDIPEFEGSIPQQGALF